jgi:molybdate transport system permease protein
MVTDAEWSGWKENPLFKAMAQEEIRNSVILSLISCTLSAFFSIGIAIPLGYFLKGKNFPGRTLLDAILDIPIVLPPLVIGLSLLILFQFPPFTIALAEFLPFIDDPNLTANSLIVYQVPAVIIAQTTVASAFAVATLKGTFEQMDSRREQVALTLGCSRFQAFNRVVLPEAAPGVITAWTLSWARSLGEFGPLLIFAGATRNKTEVLSTTVFLEMSIGNLEGAVAVSLIMIILAVIVLVITRVWGKMEVRL